MVNVKRRCNQQDDDWNDEGGHGEGRLSVMFLKMACFSKNKIGVLRGHSQKICDKIPHAITTISAITIEASFTQCNRFGSCCFA